MIYKHKQYVEIGDLVTLNNKTTSKGDALYGQPCLVVGIRLSTWAEVLRDQCKKVG